MTVMRCMVEDIKHWSSDSNVVGLGDFNGHLQFTDSYQDYNGDLVLEFPQEFSLEITNLRMDCVCITVDLASITHLCIWKSLQPT